MQKLIYLLSFLLCYNTLFSQESPFAIEVAAFAEPAPKGHFGDLEGVYETLDVNYIYRYYINTASTEAAQTLKSSVVEKGFVNARIIDFAKLRETCSAVCQYVPPAKTGKKVVAFVPTKTEVRDVQHLYAIFFDFDRAFIRSDAKIELDKLVSFMKQHPDDHLVILAHTDSRGSKTYNENLSMRRATATQDYLIKNGIRKSKTKKEIYGEDTPIAVNEFSNGNDSETGRQFNRRVEFKILDSSGNLLNVVDKINLPDEVKPK